MDGGPENFGHLCLGHLVAHDAVVQRFGGSHDRVLFHFLALSISDAARITAWRVAITTPNSHGATDTDGIVAAMEGIMDR